MEEELKQLIISRYGSVRKFAMIVNIPYANVVNVFKRDLEKTNFGYVMKICEELNLDVYDLYNGKFEDKKEKGVAMTTHEKSVLNKYRKLLKEQRKQADDLISCLFEERKG